MGTLTRPTFCRGQVSRNSPSRPLLADGGQAGGDQPQQLRVALVEAEERQSPAGALAVGGAGERSVGHQAAVGAEFVGVVGRGEQAGAVLAAVVEDLVDQGGALGGRGEPVQLVQRRPR